MDDDDNDDSGKDDDNDDGAEGDRARAVVLTAVAVVIIINRSTPLSSTAVRSAVNKTAVLMSTCWLWVSSGRSGVPWTSLGTHSQAFRPSRGSLAVFVVLISPSPRPASYSLGPPLGLPFSLLGLPHPPFRNSLYPSRPRFGTPRDEE